MIKKSLVALLVSLSVASVSFAQNWVHIGEYQIEGDEFASSEWLDVDSIVPVGKANAAGEIEIIPYTYRFVTSEDETPTLEGTIVDLKARKTLDFSSYELDWKFDVYGADEFYLNAYLIKNFEEIQKRTPFMLSDEYVLADTQTEWPVDKNGWKQVYQRDMMGEAWIQTRSVQLSSLELDEDLLPRVRVLVRYHTGGAEPVIFYSYVEYNPEGRFRNILANWDENWNPITDEASESDFYYLTQEKETIFNLATPDAAIATEAYMPFLLDPVLIKTRYSFVERDYSDNLPQEWKNFGASLPTEWQTFQGK